MKNLYERWIACINIDILPIMVRNEAMAKVIKVQLLNVDVSKMEMRTSRMDFGRQARHEEQQPALFVC